MSNTLIKRIFNRLSVMGVFSWIPDDTFLRSAFRIYTGKKLNLDLPEGYNEKLQWLKLHDRNPIYTTMVDKYLVKDYVKNYLGEEYVIPLLGVWDNANDIDFDILPERFVLKCNHDSGSTIICEDKNEIDVALIKKKLNKHLKRNKYNYAREWPYKNVVPKVIAEEYISDSKTKDLYDYKVYCFSGIPKFIMVNTGRHNGKTTANYYDANYNLMNFSWGYPVSDRISKISKEKFDDLLEKAKILSAGFPHVRVDFYEADGKIYFGELTFYDGSGFAEFDPSEWNIKIGKWIELPKK